MVSEFSVGLSCERGSEERREQGTQERLQPAEQQTEVVAGGGEDGIGPVAMATLELVALHAVFRWTRGLVLTSEFDPL
jgi:hypothetical protein